MRVLVVEDEDASLAETLGMLREVVENLEVEVAVCRDEAVELLGSQDFDIVICDLRIPAAKNDLDFDESHGLAVHAYIQQNFPGTAVIFLTGKGTLANLQSQLAQGHVADYLGLVQQPLVQLAVKNSERREIALLTAMSQGLASLEECLVEEDDSVPASVILRRAILYYGKRIGARGVKVEMLGGLSGAEVALSSYAIPAVGTRRVVVKVQDRSLVIDEQARYERNVPNKLRSGYFAPMAAPVSLFGLRKRGALYYTVAADARSLFDLWAEDRLRVTEVIRTMEADHLAWTAEFEKRVVHLGDMRRLRLPDEHPRAALLNTADFRSLVENLDIELEFCTSHGDLHGHNVLVDQLDRAMLIDYGDVGPATTALDPMALEFSFLFHEQGPKLANQLSIERLELWHDLDAFADGTELDALVRSTRGWASRVASPECILATGYVLALRSLKFEGVEAERALAVARGAAGAIATLQGHRDA